MIKVLFMLVVISITDTGMNKTLTLPILTLGYLFFLQKEKEQKDWIKRTKRTEIDFF